VLAEEMRHFAKPIAFASEPAARANRRIVNLRWLAGRQFCGPRSETEEMRENGVCSSGAVNNGGIRFAKIGGDRNGLSYVHCIY